MNSLNYYDRFPDRSASKVEATHHWRKLIDHHGICWLTIDEQQSSTNTLSAGVLEELNQLLIELAIFTPRAVIISSGKSNGFMAGADIETFSGSHGKTSIEHYIRRSHTILKRLEQLSCPTIALVHGFCLGGGLELALACRYRIVRDDTRLGFPEIGLGMQPGLGTILRLTRLLPATTAMDLMLSGRSVDAADAQQIGLVDAVTAQRHLYTAAVNGVLKGLQTNRSSTPLLYNIAPVRIALAWLMRWKTQQKVSSPASYPAPFALIDLWRKHGGSREQLSRAEARSLAELMRGTAA